MNFSRPVNVERGRVPLGGVVEEALSIAKYYKGTKSRNIESDLGGPLPEVDGVRDHLVQVLFNLILNAIDATPKDGRIVVTGSSDHRGAVLEVIDDGTGIDADSREKLFQPYFTTKQRGTGLGLFVTRKLVEEHGGRVEYETEPGVGTTFRVIIPLPTGAENGRPQPEPRTRTDGLRSGR